MVVTHLLVVVMREVIYVQHQVLFSCLTVGDPICGRNYTYLIVYRYPDILCHGVRKIIVMMRGKSQVS